MTLGHKHAESGINLYDINRVVYFYRHSRRRSFTNYLSDIALCRDFPFTLSCLFYFSIGPVLCSSKILFFLLFLEDNLSYC